MSSVLCDWTLNVVEVRMKIDIERLNFWLCETCTANSFHQFTDTITKNQESHHNHENMCLLQPLNLQIFCQNNTQIHKNAHLHACSKSRTFRERNSRDSEAPRPELQSYSMLVWIQETGETKVLQEPLQLKTYCLHVNGAKMSVLQNLRIHCGRSLRSCAESKPAG